MADRKELESELAQLRSDAKKIRTRLDEVESALTELNNRDGAIAKVAKAGLSPAELAALSKPSPAEGG
jgi:chaperonin cofactor prefoldin